MQQEKYITIYRLTNTINGKSYIGQTVDMDRRLKEHARGKNPNAAIHKAMAKYGADNFKHEVICVCANKAAADAIEIALIKLWKTLTHGYNLAPGGGGTGAGELNHRWGTKHTEEQRMALLEANRRRKGSKLSEEHKAKLSAAGKGKKLNDTQRAALIASNRARKGSTSTPETRAKLREASRQRTLKAGLYPGVYWRKDRNKWHAEIKIDGKRKSLGLFDEYQEAVRARTDAELKFSN